LIDRIHRSRRFIPKHYIY